MSSSITIIDYGLGNIYSLKQACNYLGFKVNISNNIEKIKYSDKLILPGVGSFNTAMDNLNQFKLIESLKKHVDKGKPILGICLGMQLFFDYSEEFIKRKGLGLVKGQIIKFDEKKMKVPNIGWNHVKSNSINQSNLLDNFNFEKEMYFIHSFYAVPSNKKNILLTANYSKHEYCAAVKSENIIGFQFHPEKSGEAGLILLKNYLNM